MLGQGREAAGHRAGEQLGRVRAPPREGEVLRGREVQRKGGWAAVGSRSPKGASGKEEGEEEEGEADSERRKLKGQEEERKK